MDITLKCFFQLLIPKMSMFKHVPITLRLRTKTLAIRSFKPILSTSFSITLLTFPLKTTCYFNNFYVFHDTFSERSENFNLKDFNLVLLDY